MLPSVLRAPQPRVLFENPSSVASEPAGLTPAALWAAACRAVDPVSSACSTVPDTAGACFAAPVRGRALWVSSPRWALSAQPFAAPGSPADAAAIVRVSPTHNTAAHFSGLFIGNLHRGLNGYCQMVLGIVEARTACSSSADFPDRRNVVGQQRSVKR